MLDGLIHSLPLTDPVAVFAVLLAAVLLAPLVAERLRIPGIIALILAGAILGPHALGVLQRDAAVRLLGSAGLVYLLFLAGLTLDLEQFRKLRHRSLVFGVLSFGVPAAIGVVVAPLVLGYGWSATALFAAIVGTHTLLALPVAQRLGLSRNTAVTMTVGASVVTDALGLGLLAVVVGLVDGQGGATFWLALLGKVALFLAFVLLAVPALGRWYFRRVHEGVGPAFVFLLAIVFLCAALARGAGLAPIIGAFLAGVMLNRLVPNTGPLMARLQFVGENLFIPFFLVSVGMLLQVGGLVAGGTVPLAAAAYIGAVCVGKVGSAVLAARLWRLDRAEGWLMGGLTVPQAAATLAVTMVGFEKGLLDQTAVDAVIVLILVTCLVGPMMVERLGRRVALAARPADARPATAQERILIPLGNPATAEALVDLALLLRDPASTEPICPLNVTPGGADVHAQVAHAEHLLGSAMAHAAAANVPVVPLTRVDPSVASGMLRAITEARISTVVIGWNGEVSAHERIFGSVLDHVLEQTTTLVVVCRQASPLNLTRRVVVAVPLLAERHPGIGATWGAVKRLTHRLGAQLVGVTVTGQGSMLAPALAAARPEVATSWIELEGWSALPGRLGAMLRPDDLLVLLSARRGTVAWQPGLDRLPARLAAALPRQNLLVVFPADAPADSVAAGPEARGPGPAGVVRLGDLLPLAHIAIGLERVSLPAAVRHMLAAAGPRVATLDAAHVGDPERFIELSRGVILFHTHQADVPAPTLLVGVSPAGLDCAAFSGPVHLVVLLLGPQVFDPPQHLAILAAVANRLRDPAVVQACRMADRPERVRSAFAPDIPDPGVV